MQSKPSIAAIYQFDPTIPDYQKRLDLAYSFLFKKIGEMEAKKKLRGNKKEGNAYGGQTLPQL